MFHITIGTCQEDIDYRLLLRVSEANEVPISSHIKTFYKIGKKIEYIFTIILGIAESFKTINRPGPTQPNPTQSDRNSF